MYRNYSLLAVWNADPHVNPDISTGTKHVNKNNYEKLKEFPYELVDVQILKTNYLLQKVRNRFPHMIKLDNNLLRRERTSTEPLHLNVF